MSIRNFTAHFVLIGVLFNFAAQARAATTALPHENISTIHHVLSVELTPSTHELSASDHITMELDPQVSTVTFLLASSLQVESIAMRTSSVSSIRKESEEVVPFTSVRPHETTTQRIVVSLPTGHSRQITLIWTYRGRIDDPPKEPRHLRFVTPSETAGHIGDEGVYLSGESHWYPDVMGAFSTYRVTTQVPQGWTVVASGRKEGETTGAGKTSSTWVVQAQSEAFTLVANTFVTTSREWRSSTGQRVELQTHFLPDNAGLADEYLDATAKYLDAYIGILGEYPFDKFAVVENFFPSGLGMPSFTLLGSGSIKRHYVQPYALGHEIVHAWIGNSVFNRDDQGNWVEGLTTYLANYYWHELTHDTAQALEQRRMMLQGYNLYVGPEADYAVAQFLRKHDERDNAIGYQKSAFVFHLLRGEIGDESFWRGVKALAGEYRNRPADWGSLETVFSQSSGQDLRWFFRQWVEQPGAPVLSLGTVQAHRTQGEDDKEAWQLTVQVQQTGKLFRMAVPLRIVMKEGSEDRSILLDPASVTSAHVVLPHQPVRVELDPDVMSFRRLSRSQLSPMLNAYVTDSRKTVMRAFADPASPLQRIVSRLADQDVPESQKANVLSMDAQEVPPEGSVLILAGAEQRHVVQPIVQDSCGDQVVLTSKGFLIDGRVYEGPKMATVFSCHRKNMPGSVLTVVYGMTSGAVEKISRLLFYYGWHSAVVFEDGTVITREVWHGQQEMKEVRIDAIS